jgi:hypothetical protein
MQLEQLQTNAVIRGIIPDALVTVVSVQWFGSEALELTYKTPAGKVANKLLYRHDEPRKELVARGDLQRCLIICPGNLAEQWQDELYRRFSLPFELGKLQFQGKSLRELLIEAIRHGERPEVKAFLTTVLDAALDRGHLQSLIEERVLAHNAMDASRVRRIRDRFLCKSGTIVVTIIRPSTAH